MNESKRPKCPIIGADGNIFNIMGLASKTLKLSNLAEEANEISVMITVM